jgi:3-phenylpropionate/trans-cinnamate dioxygenase ferredoxin reductase subunit
MNSEQTYVIIGAGQAGGWAAKTLRDQGFEGRVVIYGDENFAPHERPPLSKEVLLGQAEKDSCLLWPPGTLEDAHIEMCLGVSVKSIDSDNHLLTLDSGKKVTWSKLLLATGGRARSLDIEGIGLNGVYTLRTIEDAERIRAGLTEGAKVLVIGAGWIGLEVAAAARKRGASATVVEVADRVCARALTADMSQWLHALHERNGVDIRLETTLSHFAGGHKLEKALLKDGTSIDCDLAIIGIGLIPNTELATAAGLHVDNGVVVDETGQTSHPDIYSAGDVTNHPNPLLGRRVRLESWENAQNQAINAAKSMLGSNKAYAEIPWFWSDQYDANIQMMGLPEEWDQTVTRGNPKEGNFIEFYLKGGQIQGATAVNNPRDLRFTRRMITSGKIFNADALSDPEVKLQKLMKD